MKCVNDVQTIQKFFSNSFKDFQSEIDPSIILLKNLTGLEGMEGMKDIKSDGSVGNETEKGGSIHRPSFDDNYGHFTAIVQ